jgi:hypothetical protein
MLSPFRLCFLAAFHQSECAFLVLFFFEFDASIDLFFDFAFFNFSSFCGPHRKENGTKKEEKREEYLSLSLRLACQVSLSLSLSLLRTHLLFPLWECATQTRRCLRPLLRPSDADPRARRSQQIWRTKMSSRRVTSRNTIARRIVGSSCTIACTT